MKKVAWKGWSLEFTARAWRLLVIAVLLAIGAAANSFSPSLPFASMASTTPVATFDPVPINRDAAVTALKERTTRTTRKLASYRRSAQVQLAIDELRSRALLLPIPNVPVEDLRNSFTHLRGDGSRRHYAIDIPAVRGTPILAPEDGTVIQLHESKQGGITLYATDRDQRFIYFFAHLDRYHPTMKEGLTLTRGDTIGYVGSTGNAIETGPHLHFAIMMSSNIARWSAGTPLNPFEVYKY
jgi:murein DD-endopeptidase MepM/ murein hydrolase activator NlpD